MRKVSGKVDSDSKLVSFLYLLMRDHLPAGVVEGIIQEVTIDSTPVQFTNGWLASYSKDIEERLKAKVG